MFSREAISRISFDGKARWGKNKKNLAQGNQNVNSRVLMNMTTMVVWSFYAKR
jgi:hypothetical protein